MIFKLVRKEVLGPIKRMGLRLIDELLHINDPMPSLRRPAKPFYFVHVPKTAGTSFTHYLLSHWNHHNAYAPILRGEISSSISGKMIKLYHGHIEFSSIKNSDQYFLITFLRDPIDRCISQYKSWNNPKNFQETNPWRKIMSKEEIDQILLAQKLTLSEFILCENPSFDKQLFNLQSRMLCDKNNGKYDYNTAIFNVLNRFNYVGIVERFDWSIEKFRSMFSKSLPYQLPEEVENRSIRPDLKLAPKALQRLLDMNQHDINLYETVSSHFFGDKKLKLAA